MAEQLPFFVVMVNNKGTLENYEYANIKSNYERTIHEKEDSIHKTMISNFRLDKTRKIENVLILQEGGSLGAFGCGVIKGLSKKEYPLTQLIKNQQLITRY